MSALPLAELLALLAGAGLVWAGIRFQQPPLIGGGGCRRPGACRQCRQPDLSGAVH